MIGNAGTLGSTPYAEQNPTDVLGLDISCTDGPDIPPTITGLSRSEVEGWFTSHPSGPAPAIRLLVLDNHDSTAPAYTEPVIRHAIWTPDAYLTLLASSGGGCAALLDDPWCFVLQTPRDAGPACSLALSRHGHVVKGLYSYDSKGFRTATGGDPFEPRALMQGERIQSGWRSTGLQIISLPLALAKAHALYIAAALRELLRTVSAAERALGHHAPGTTTTALDPWNLRLHACATQLLDLERRVRLQCQLLAAIATLTATHPHYKTRPYPPLAPLHSQHETWAFDLTTLPRRLENLRSAIATARDQRTTALQLSIAVSSRAMAEAARRDTATMRTIALLTMLFLPSTAVATFFSMGMFDWSARGGRGMLPGGWLWVFFAVAGPLTGGVVGWWLWVVRRGERGVVGREGDVERGELLGDRDGNGVEDVEAGGWERRGEEVDGLEMTVDGKGEG
ncbi:hypothetical protein LTR53_000541 [Teratosphaeriaceae sp. CCFEE 6253]|nr:hypothetical protein LTR53_000541 [Teratosphaeriaceae sp. CCFEE 6253]